MCLAASSLPFYQTQIEFMLTLAKGRPEALNPFFLFLNYFDTPYFFFVLIPAIWLGISYKWGLRIYYWSTLNSLLNFLVKNWVGWPRPSTEIPELGLLHPTSYGFPSGGAQTSIFLGILLIYYWKSRKARLIGAAYILLISFSRIYLGVHFPIDIMGGWAIGACLAFLFIQLKEPIDRFFERQTLQASFLLSLLAPLALALLDPTGRYFAGFMVGVSLGTYFSLEYKLFLPKAKSFMKTVQRVLLGIAFLWAFIIFWPKEVPGQSFASALFISLAASPICKRILD